MSGSGAKTRVISTFILLVLVITAIIWGGSYCFNNVQTFRELFAVPGSDVYGNVAAESGETLAKRSELTARISMWIFVFITALQIVALWVGYVVISNIRCSSDDVKLKLKNLENAEIFFDIPLYFGLFGTVSAFLVMTFSPQSSRLIAYSSTLIGIIFSLLLRLMLQYPLRRTLVRQEHESVLSVEPGDETK